MDMKAVKSSTIKAVGHDPQTNTLHVEFNNGGIYAYENVDAKIHDAMMKADSIGRFHGAHLKDTKKHPFKRIDQGKKK